MVTAVILVNVERHKLNEVIRELMQIDGITEVHSVAGDYDMVAIARVKDNQQLSSIVADKMCSQMEGILHLGNNLFLVLRSLIEEVPEISAVIIEVVDEFIEINIEDL